AETWEVFAAVAREAAEVMHLPVAAVQRYEAGETMTVIAAWSDRAHPFQPGTRWPYHASGLAASVRQTGRAGRVVDYSHRRGAGWAAWPAAADDPTNRIRRQVS